MPNSIAIAPRDETLRHAIVSKSLTEPMRQNYRRFSMCGETMVIGGFPLQRESNAGIWCLTLTNEGRSGDMPLCEPPVSYFSDVVSYWLPVEIWANQQQDSIGWYDGLVQIRWQAIIWINDGNFTCNTHSCRTWDNFMTMRQATIWRHICWANYRTQYCWIFMKFIGTDGNINTALSVTYQMDMPEFFSRRWIQMNYFVNLFYITKHALRGNRKFKVVRLCSKLVGDSLWSSGLCMPNVRQIGKKICDAGVKPPSI